MADGNVGSILIKVQEDLSKLRHQLDQEDGQVDASTLKEALQRTEEGLKMRAEEVLHMMNNKVASLPSMEEQLGGGGGGDMAELRPSRAVWDLRTNTRGQLQPRRTGPTGLLESRGMDGGALRGVVPQPAYATRQLGVAAQLPQLSPGEEFQREGAQRILLNPQNPHARRVANEHFGIQLPLISSKTAEKFAKDRIVKGSNVERLAILPKANRVDAQLAPPPITEADAQKGILSLMERGLIPPAADIELDPPPVRHKTVRLHDPAERAFESMPADASEPGFNLAGYKLDPKYRAADIAASRPSVPEQLARALAARQQHQQQQARRHSAGKTASVKQFDLQLDGGETFESHVGSSVAGPAEKRLHIVPPPTTPASQLSKTGSTYRFAVQNGKSREQSNDFVAFKQHYCLSWGSIVTVLKHMEKFLTKYSVPIAFINGDRLADLSIEYELELVPTEAELLHCVINREDVEDLIRKPGRQFVGPNGLQRAALTIQAQWRGFVERKRYLEYRQQKWAAGVIAIRWILHMKLTTAKKQLATTRQRELDNFRMRAKRTFGNWERLQKQRRVIVHIPSLGFTQRMREDLEDFPKMQNTQMARLCDLSDPNVDVVYVSPVPINDELLQYYSKLLGLKNAIDSGKVENQKPISDRYKIIVPEAIKSFPTHNMCLATLLKYSPRALRRIRNIVRGRAAYIVPGLPHVDDLSVAEFLNVPVLSPEPEVAQLYSTKSGAKRIFAAAGVDGPPGEFDVYSLDQLHECLAQLITENLSVRRWLLKIDNEFGGRGIAYVDIDRHLKCYGWALKERERYGEKWSKKWAQENAYLRILDEVPELLASHARPANKGVYPAWRDFLEAYLAMGGVVEAFPPSDSVTNITVDLLLEPGGQMKIVNCGDQLHDASPLRSWGLSVPQSSIETSVLNNVCEKISNACQQRHIIGHFSVDFATFIDPEKQTQQLWPTDLTIRFSDTAALAKLICFATNGQFVTKDHVIEIPPKPHVEKKQRKWKFQQEDDKPDKQRFAVLSANLMHTNLAVVHYSVFFQMCRAHGIGYDVQERQGTMFSLIDSFDRQNMCMVTISDSLEGALESFGRNLYVIHQEISSPAMQGESNFRPVIKDIEDILGLAIENAKVGPDANAAV